MESVGGHEVMADTASSPPVCDVDGACYCPLTGVITSTDRTLGEQGGEKSGGVLKVNP